jgi:hypothetical protein
MSGYNRNFELDVNDIDLIEAALRSHKRVHSLERLRLIEEEAAASDDPRLAQVSAELSRVQDLLGRLHNQKIFYRPKRSEKAPYIGG